MSDIKSDKLFLAWNCMDCTKVKMHIQKSMFDDEIIGHNGQILNVIHTFSNSGTRDILDIFGIESNTPSLLTSDGKILSGPDNIISYLKEQGLTTDSKI